MPVQYFGRVPPRPGASASVTVLIQNTPPGRRGKTENDSRPGVSFFAASGLVVMVVVVVVMMTLRRRWGSLHHHHHHQQRH